MLLNLESGAYAFTADSDEGEVTIGRENDCSFIVKEDGISRHHCKLWFENGNWLVLDTESRHGTLVNNKQIQKPTVLKTGDVLKLSGVNFMVSLHATNDPKDIGKALAGGAREKLKMLNTGPKGPPAKPTRILKSPPKKAAAPVVEADEPSAEAPASDAPAAGEKTASEDVSSDVESDAETVAVASKEKPSGSKVRPGVKGAASKTRTKGGKPAQEAPKKGGGMLKIVAAVVIFAGAGAAAYFALGKHNEAGKDKPTEAKKDDDAPKDESKTEEVPKIPAKPHEGEKSAPKEEPAPAPKADEKPAP